VADDRRRRRVGLGRRLGHGPRGASQRGVAARVAIELTRLAGRSTASLTSATITGVIAVAITVPACQILETTVAADDGGDRGGDQRGHVQTAAGGRRLDGLGSGAPAWRSGRPMRVGL
jgi:hypothetical protein